MRLNEFQVVDSIHTARKVYDISECLKEHSSNGTHVSNLIAETC